MLALRLAELGAQAPSHRAYREGVLTWLKQEVPYDGALFHALSPRVPLETAVMVGLDPERVAHTMPRWDALAVELGRLRVLANEHLAVRDVEAFPHGSAARERFVALGLEPLGARGLLMVHLIVRGEVHAAVLLTTRLPDRFSEAHVALLRGVAPLIAMGDLLHAKLDHTRQASQAVALRCSDGRLTPRQREIVEHVAHGHTNEAIAQALGISPHTLRNHLAAVFAKLGAANRADVVRLAVLTARE